uniref:Internal scaffolding protein n=1 Tax=Dulem virus 141 TaxID=3145618 RepID=A0AAU8B1F6_9VIRU
MFQTLYNRRKTRKDINPLDPDEPDQTRQEFAQDADINFLISRYNETGAFYDALSLRGKEPRLPLFEDFSDLPDFGDAQQFISDSRERFMALPAKIREKFDNDPALLLAWISDPANKDEAVKLGLISGVQGTVSPATAAPAEPKAKTEPDEGK